MDMEDAKSLEAPLSPRSWKRVREGHWGLLKTSKMSAKKEDEKEDELFYEVKRLRHDQKDVSYMASEAFHVMGVNLGDIEEQVVSDGFG